MGFPNVIMVERVGALYKGIDAKLDKIQRYLSEVTNPNMEKGTLAEVAKGADILVGVSGPNLFTKEIIGSMADKAIVLGLPTPCRKRATKPPLQQVRQLPVPDAATAPTRLTM